jgi:hypothetical protein
MIPFLSQSFLSHIAYIVTDRNNCLPHSPATIRFAVCWTWGRNGATGAFLAICLTVATDVESRFT